MGYIDAAYYTDMYKGSQPDDTNTLSTCIERASDTIDMVTGYKLKDGTVDLATVHPFIQDQVKLATAVMAERYIIDGGYEESISGGVQSMSLGGFNYTEKQGNADEVVPSRVLSILAGTGLLYAGTQAGIHHVY